MDRLKIDCRDHGYIGRLPTFFFEDEKDGSYVVFYGDNKDSYANRQFVECVRYWLYET